MDARKIAEEHLDAWRREDPETVASVSGYEDPGSGGVLCGPELAAYAAALMDSFKNLRFEVEAVTGDADAVTVSWTLTADHRAAYLGMPATGGTARVTGTDLVTAGGHVRRTFDRLALAEALGYAARFVPEADDVREFGTSARTSSGRTDRPGAFSLTWLEIRDAAEAADVDLLSVEIVKSLRASRGFLGVTTVDVGNRKYTLSAFDTPESVRAVHARPHQRAMRRFFRSGLCTRVHTSIWLPAKSREYARCPGCASVVPVGTGTACGCGWLPDDASLL
ncbi:ester cyclase [Nonomuraea typhae]|uniref:ester cyclase n=1 Tax=Nonomuraea typhae TaxID=2603600 RepID=UPI0012FA00F4|nr:ester cyclase [Nonomuraea typhae]